MDHKESCLLYASDELDRGQAAEFERHLKGCPACSQRLAVARLAHGLAPETIETPSARLVENALAGVRGRAALPVRRALPRQLALAGTLASVLAVLVYVNIGRTPPAPEVPATPAPSLEEPKPGPALARKPRPPRRKLAARDLSASFKLRPPDENAARIRFAGLDSGGRAAPAVPSIILRQPAPVNTFPPLRR